MVPNEAFAADAKDRAAEKQRWTDLEALQLLIIT